VRFAVEEVGRRWNSGELPVVTGEESGMRVGIVGVGAMGTVHAAAWRQTPAEVVGFVATTAATAEPLAAAYGARAYGSLEELLHDVDVVDLCTPTHLHYEQTLLAAAAGKHVVCEKPLARSMAQAAGMIAACRAAGVKLLVAHVVRFFPEYVRAKAAVDAGQVGQLAVLRFKRNVFQPKKAEDNWFVDPDKSGGLILDLMIHDFDCARWLAGDVVRIMARSVGQQHPGARFDHALAILTHANGAISHVEGSWAYPPPTFRTQFEIAGSQGLILHDSEATAAVRTFRQSPAVDSPDVPVPNNPLLEDPYTTQIKAFYAALAYDTPLPVTAEDGLKALEIALAAMVSAQTGAVVGVGSRE
jgi:predicted dehydrogenase